MTQADNDYSALGNDVKALEASLAKSQADLTAANLKLTAANLNVDSLTGTANQLQADAKTSAGVIAAQAAKILQLQATQTLFDVVVAPGTPNALQAGLNAVPVNGSIFIANGHYTETPTIPHACKVVGQSELGVIIDLNAKPFTLTFPAGSTFKNATVINAVFGKPQMPAVLITDGSTADRLTITGDSVGLAIHGSGGAGGSGITASNISTPNCGELGLSVTKTRGCVITQWTADNCCSPTSFNPTKAVYSPASEGGACKATYNDGLRLVLPTVTNTPCNGIWHDTGNTNCTIENPTVTGCGMPSNPGGYAGIMIEQNDGTNSVLGTTGPTVAIKGGALKNNQHNDVLVAESSGVSIDSLEYHDQVGFRQMASRASKVHGVSITNCQSYGSTYGDNSYTKTPADIAAQKITMDGTTYHGQSPVGFWCGGTQKTIANLQALGFDAKASLVTG